MTPEVAALVAKYLPWAVPLIPVLPFIPRAIKAYKAKVKQIADDAVAEEAAEKARCDERVAQARVEFKAEVDQKLQAQAERIAVLERDAKTAVETMTKTRNGIVRVLLMVAAAKSDPTMLDGIMDDLREIAEGL